MDFRIEVAKSQEYQKGVGLVSSKGGRVTLHAGDEVLFSANGTGNVTVGASSIPLGLVSAFVKAASAESTGDGDAPVKRRGRPAKVKVEETTEAPKKRGRPAKVKAAGTEKPKVAKSEKKRLKMSAVVEWVSAQKDVVSPTDVAKHFEIEAVGASGHLKRACDAGELRKVGRGEYTGKGKKAKAAEAPEEAPKKVKKAKAEEEEEAPKKVKKAKKVKEEEAAEGGGEDDEGTAKAEASDDDGDDDDSTDDDDGDDGSDD